MRFTLSVFLICFWGKIWGQKEPQVFPIQEDLAHVEVLMVDDYGAVYLHNNNTFTLKKIDALGKNVGRIQIPIPFKIQPVNNPMQIVLFSEQAQEIRLLDLYLVEKQKIPLNHLGFIKTVHLEDQQIIWLVDEANSRIVQYNYRQEKIINVIPLYLDLQKIKEILVFNNYFYILKEEKFEVYNHAFLKIFSIDLLNPYRLKREDESIIIFDAENIWKYENKKISNIKAFSNKSIVDKNESVFYQIEQGKLYLYPLN